MTFANTTHWMRWSLDLNVTVKIYFTNEDLSCNSKNVTYFFSCDKCKDEYGCALDFKSCFKEYKSNINTKKARCDSSRYFSEKYVYSTSPFEYVEVQIIDRGRSRTAATSKIEHFGIIVNG